MAKINIPFNNANYAVDESALAAASADLKAHLQNVMNGSGAVVNFGGTAYSIDSAKLTAATNEFVTHLGTIAGSGEKIVVNGVEYNIDSNKIATAIADIHTALGNLHAEDNAGDETGDVLDNAFPIEFNTREVSTNTSVIFNDNKFVRVSNFIPTAEELQACEYKVVLSTGGTYIGTCSSIDASSGATYVIYTAKVNGISFSAHLCVVPAAGEYAGVAIPHAGVYVLDMWQTFGHDANISIGAKSSSDLSLPNGAYYVNLATGAFYTEMPETVSENDVYLYEDYVYVYRPEVNGWAVVLATAESGVLNFMPNYPVTDQNQSSYSTILDSINNVPVVSMGHFMSEEDEMYNDPIAMTFVRCKGIRSVQPATVSGVPSVIIPNTIKSMVATFEDCTSLLMAWLPNSLTSIGKFAFRYCSALQTVVIPNSVVRIDDQAFDLCTSLTQITFLGTIEQWNAIVKAEDWKREVPATEVTCTDGNVSLV